jgi:hypothetical protein
MTKDEETKQFISDYRRINMEDPETMFKSPNALATLRKCFDLTDEKEIKDACEIYAKTIEGFRAYGKKGMTKSQYVDWALPAAISPEWYNDSLSIRLNNAMLVSALLVTVTAANLVSPPGLDIESTGYRAFMYLNAVTTYLFLFSIILGIFFIENALSRSYGKIERLFLVQQFYAYKDASQIFMALGATIFPFCFSSTLWSMATKSDAAIIFIFAIFYVMVVIMMLIHTYRGANAWLERRLRMVMVLTDDRGHLQAEYQPTGMDLQTYVDLFIDEVSSK